MFKLLIIDDDIRRKDALELLFKYDLFVLEFVFDKRSLFQKKLLPFEYDCIFCDISLDIWASDGDINNMFKTVVSFIGNKIPLVIYSSDFKQVSYWTNNLLSEKFNLIYTIALKQISEIEKTELTLEPYIEKSQIICNNIFIRLNAINGYSILKKTDDQEISILHISDLQFGDKDQHVELSNTFASALKREISNKKISEVDFIVITGDIAYDGSPSQYKNAAIWITNLCECILGEDFQDRILLAPGNHDINLSLCSLNKYKYKFPNDETNINNVELELRELITSEYTFYSLDPFKDFAYNLTKDVNWLNNDSLSFINNKFCYLGFRFMHLNTLNPDRQLGNINPEFSINRAFITKIQKENSLLNKSELSTIVITHPSPKYLGCEIDENGPDMWTTISSFFKDINVDLYLYGHRHKNLKEWDVPLDKEMSFKISGTSTLLCNTDIGEPRGFKIIKILRKNNVVKKYKIECYNYKNGGQIIKES